MQNYYIQHLVNLSNEHPSATKWQFQ